MHKFLGSILSVIPILGCMEIFISYKYFIPKPEHTPNITLRGMEIVLPILHVRKHIYPKSLKQVGLANIFAQHVTALYQILY